MFPTGLERRCQKVLDGLLDHEVGSPAFDHERIRVSGTPASKTAAPPPPGTHVEAIDAKSCPPIGVSPYAHFRWMFDHAQTEDQAIGILHAAERLLHRLNSPTRLGDLDDAEQEDARRLLLQGRRSGDEIAETILAQYVDYDSDTVDLIEGLKPGTTRKVRASNFADELGHQKGVPKWMYREFELLDEIGGRDACIDRFQIALSTYYDIRSRIRRQNEAA